MIVVYGKTSSGKSQVAEDIAVSLGDRDSLIYLATMENSSDAAKERIEHHRKLRANKGFVTIEEMYNPSAHAAEYAGKTVLLECVSNLVANVLFKTCGAEALHEADVQRVSEEIENSIKEINNSAKNLVVVTNDVFGNGPVDDEWCVSYMKVLAEVNRLLARDAQKFIEVTLGQSTVLKE